MPQEGPDGTGNEEIEGVDAKISAKDEGCGMTFLFEDCFICLGLLVIC